MIYFGNDITELPNTRGIILLAVFWLLVIISGIVLKLYSIIDASWWIVLMPLWAPVLALLFIFAILIFSVVQFNRSAPFEREDYDRD